ncbi:MAG: division/cell wall cluster transcriptional repressor MraZ [Candidatus Omnitrophica bacterium]|nr:division/cell wall cluster transcriptional repressor MraZ [Candidatus Omnitrophota bacterium]
MFYGEYTHNLDAKGRLILPARFREVADQNSISRFFVTRGLEACMFMFPESEWRQYEQKLRDIPFTKQDGRTFNRMFFAGAVDVVPDKQGRFVIPQYLKDFAGIKEKSVIIGVSNRIEIWDHERWQEYFTKSSKLFEQTAENLLSL